MADDSRMSVTTWQRTWRHHPKVELALIRLSARRLGMRRSVWREILAEGARKP